MDQAKRKVIPFVKPEAVTEIQKLQPYSTGNGVDDLLWMLHNLDIIDKHRLHIVTKQKIRATYFRVSADNGQELSVPIPDTGPWQSTEDGAEILRIQIAKDVPFPIKMKVEIETAIAVQIEHTGLACDGENLLAVLRDFIEYVAQIVDTFGRIFFGE